MANAPFLIARATAPLALAIDQSIGLGEWVSTLTCDREFTRAPIVGLFRSRRPSAIAQFVVSVVIDAVDGMLDARSDAHVGKKIFKCFPPVTDHYSSSAIIHPRFKFRITTPIEHSLPYPMGGRVGHAVRSVCSTNHERSIAAAGFCKRRGQRSQINHGQMPAIAPALPCPPSSIRFGLPDQNKHVVSIARKVFFNRHAGALR